MRQKFSVTVADVPMTISCEETEESIGKAETELDAGMRALLDAPGSNCNKMEAAILLALDYCTRLAHAKDRVRELEDYVNAADPNGDQFGASLLRGENEKLRAELEISRGVNDTLSEDNTILYTLHAKSEKQITEANARADRLNDRSPELRVQKILISLFAGMYLRRDLARERRIQRVQHLHDLFRRNLSRKINL